MRTAVWIALFALVAVVAGTAPLLHADSSTIIPGSYIIVMRDGIDARTRDEHVLNLKDTIAARGADAEVGWTYTIGSMIGFSARLSKDLLALELEHPDVKYVECDQTASISKFESHQHLPFHAAPAANTVVTQTGATWGLDRIDQHDLPLNGLYIYNSAGGLGVDAYIIDTGILATHVDFGGRAQAVFTSVPTEPNTDLNGHGTHCAGTIGGTTYGVAKNVSLYAVKVIGASGSGTIAAIVAGIDYVINNQNTSRKSVASMSLGGSASTTWDQAVANLITAGVVTVVAAGNSNANACNYSPARVPTAVTVGATASDDSRSTFSNYGTCVSIFAPGTAITSDWIGSNTATNTISGTSMATPHVAGALALHLSVDSTLNPAASKSWVTSQATPNKVTNVGTGSPNLLLYSPSS